MGVGFVLDWKSVISNKSPLLANSTTRLYSPSVRGKEASYESARVSIYSEENETLHKDTMKSYTGSFGALQIVDNGLRELEQIKINIGKGFPSTLYNPDDYIKMSIHDDASTSYSNLQMNNKSSFGLLMDNLEKIEESFVNEDSIKLERDILIQLGKLGILKTDLSMTLTPSTPSTSLPHTKSCGDYLIGGGVDNQVGNVVVRSGKTEERKTRRERSLEKASKISVLSSSSSKAIGKVPRWGTGSAAKNSTNPKSRRLAIAMSESDMSRGIKDVADLERIKINLEKESGCMAHFSSWAEAAGVDEKVLQQHLHFGWCCRDRLLTSTKSLVVFLASKYRGLGISSEDLIQAGNLGVLKGAERYDHTRGYQFSTFIQYWIRKYMTEFLTRNSREIYIPIGLSRVRSKIQKARKALSSIHGKYPHDDEIARFTGLSVAKVTAASKCPRIVGSINQKTGDHRNVKFMEFTSDPMINTPEETVMRQHMQNDIYELLKGLHPRERQVLILRNGLWDGQCRSLEEIGRLCKRTKEWIRKIERSALEKLRQENIQKNLSPYLNLQL